MKPFTYLSLGAGVQSSALYILSSLGQHDVPRADVAVFADTQDEPSWVYQQIKDLRDWAPGDGIHIETVSKGKLSDEAKDGSVRIPAFTWVETSSKEGMLRRECTQEYKIRPIEQFVRSHLGFKKGQRIPTGFVRNMIGYSCDEASRMSPSKQSWIERIFPLIDSRLYRSHCLRIVEDQGLPTPKKSACVYCPFHSDRYWAELKNEHPEEFSKAVAIDAMLREHSNPEVSKRAHLKNTIYVHRSCKPLGEIDFGDQPDLFDEECAGVCGL